MTNDVKPIEFFCPRCGALLDQMSANVALNLRGTWYECSQCGKSSMVTYRTPPEQMHKPVNQPGA